VCALTGLYYTIRARSVKHIVCNLTATQASVALTATSTCLHSKETRARKQSGRMTDVSWHDAMTTSHGKMAQTSGPRSRLLQSVTSFRRPRACLLKLLCPVFVCHPTTVPLHVFGIGVVKYTHTTHLMRHQVGAWGVSMAPR
jgi:hypothetical protein